jgi:hypothetical protein
MKKGLFLLLICLFSVYAATLRKTVIEGQLSELMQKIKDKTVVLFICQEKKIRNKLR